MDVLFMKRALELAKLGVGYTSPNPLVGAVIVKDGRIIAEGYHQHYGGPHAEVNAFLNATEDVSGATMYVTLEPCSHFGKTPPCAHAIIDKKIKRVVIAMEDPNPLVAGRGIQILRDHGIPVTLGIFQKESEKLNEVFIKYITTNLPFVVLKTAMTLDGKIASTTGDSKWITDPYSRSIVHRLRHQYAGIMVGIGTVLSDDPLLTTRLGDGDGHNPVRIIVDSHGKIPMTAKVLDPHLKGSTVLAVTDMADPKKIKAIEDMGTDVVVTPIQDGRVDLCYLMKVLAQKKIDGILLEGGSTLSYGALRADIVDKVISFIAPKIIGGQAAKTPVGGVGMDLMKDAILLRDMEITKLENDVMIEAYIRREA